jgi:hypothetical protein
VIRDLDVSLKQMFVGEATPATELAGANITFAVPDKDWRGQGKGLDLDVYLYRVLDNRELRSNERRLRYNGDGTVTTELFPSRIECSYLISAWNKAAPMPGVEKELLEHRLLSQVLYVLWRNPTMPSKYLSGLLANAEIALPIIAAESEDMAAKPDFWTTLDTYAKPAITCRITIALDIDLDVTGPMLSTAQISVGSDRMLYLIGGTARSSLAPHAAVPLTWVRLDAGPATATSDDQGNFTFDRITPGAHVLTARAVGFKEAVKNINVPDTSGAYDITLIPA